MKENTELVQKGENKWLLFWSFLYPSLLILSLLFSYITYEAPNELLHWLVYSLSIMYAVLICLHEYYDDIWEKLFVSYERSIFMTLIIAGSLIYNICRNGYGVENEVTIFIFLSCVAAFVWDGKKRERKYKESKKEEECRNNKKDLLYRAKFLNRTHYRIRKIANEDAQGIIIGIVGSWGSGKTYMIDMLNNCLCEDLKDNRQIPDGYNRAFKICDRVELWQATSLEDAWNRVIFSLHIGLFGKPPLIQSKFWRTISNLCTLNNAARQICEIVEPEFENREVEAIGKKLVDKKVVLVFDDLERAKFEVINAMLPLLERLKQFPNLVVICAVAEDELCEALRRNGINPEYTYGYLNKLFDLRFELPALADDGIKNYIQIKLDKKYRGCSLAESFFQQFFIPYDNPRQIDKCVEKIASIEQQYFSNFHQTINFNTITDKNFYILNEIKYIFAVEMLKIVSPQTLCEIAKDYGREMIPTTMIMDVCINGILLPTDEEKKGEKKWGETHPVAYSEIRGRRPVRKIVDILLRNIKTQAFSPDRRTFLNAINKTYTRTCGLNEIEAKVIIENEREKAGSFAEQLQRHWEKDGEKLEPEFQGSCECQLFLVAWNALIQGDDGMFPYLESSVNGVIQDLLQHNIQFRGTEHFRFFDLIVEVFGNKKNEEKQGSSEKIDRLTSLLSNIFRVIPIKQQARELSRYNSTIRNEEDSPKGTRKMLDIQVLKTKRYHDFMSKLVYWYAYSLVMHIHIGKGDEKEDCFIYQAYCGFDQDLMSQIKRGVKDAVNSLEDTEELYMSLLKFVGIRYESYLYDEVLSSFATRDVAEMIKYIKDVIVASKKDFYFSLSPEKVRLAQTTCHDSLSILKADREDWIKYGKGNGGEYIAGITQLIELLQNEGKSILESVQAV